MNKPIQWFLAIFLNTVFISSAFAAPGDLDTTFGTDGIVKSAFSGAGETDEAFDLLLQSDGKLVVVAQFQDAVTKVLELARYNSDGSLDTTFGTNGKVREAFMLDDFNAVAGALQSDGKIVVGGTIFDGPIQDFGVARFNADGTPDTSFSNDGVDTTDFGGNDGLDDVAIQSDGKIVAVGSAKPAAANEMAVARYNAGGGLDLDFSKGDADGDGVLRLVIGKSARARAVAIQSDGKIVIAGSSFDGMQSDFGLVRFNADGTLDTDFAKGGSAGDGIALTDFFGEADSARDISILANGKILLAGITSNSANTNFALAQYNDDGTLDTSFGVGGADGDGKVSTDFLGDVDTAYHMVVQSDGKIILAGRTSNGVERDIALARYNVDGSLDTSFGAGGADGDGLVTTDHGDDDGSGGVVVQSDGKIVAGGTSFEGFAEGAHNGNIVLARYEAEEPAPIVDNDNDDGNDTVTVSDGSDTGGAGLGDTGGCTLIRRPR